MNFGKMVPENSSASKDSGLQSIEESTALSELFTADWSKKSHVTVRLIKEHCFKVSIPDSTL